MCRTVVLDYNFVYRQLFFPEVLQLLPAQLFFPEEKFEFRYTMLLLWMRLALSFRAHR